MGIAVDDELLARWVGWFAPDAQPFLVDGTHDPAIEAHIDGRPLPGELLDTFELYGTSERFRLAWFDEAMFMALDPPTRAALVRSQVVHGRSVVPTVRRWRVRLGDDIARHADGHRFIWWPSLMTGHEREVVSEFVTNGRPSSDHRDVPSRVWTAASAVLPRITDLAGTFPAGSGPNCFGAVMAASGVAGADHTMMQREPFEAWLASTTRPGGRDDAVGTVLVWRNADDDVEHAAVTIGDGWAFHKPSVGWMSPYMVMPVDDLKRVSRHPGLRLTRSAITT